MQGGAGRGLRSPTRYAVDGTDVEAARPRFSRQQRLSDVAVAAPARRHPTPPCSRTRPRSRRARRAGEEKSWRRPASARARGGGRGAVSGVLRRKNREREDAGGGTDGRWGNSWGGASREGSGLRDVSPLHVAAYIPPRVGPHGEAAPRGDPGAEARRHQGGDAGGRPLRGDAAGGLTARGVERAGRPSDDQAAAAAAGLPPSTCCHTFPATAYLSNGGPSSASCDLRTGPGRSMASGRGGHTPARSLRKLRNGCLSGDMRN